ncbi:MAG: iron-containing alcohol dehydrogenase [Clostridia bacterium]|nr:iron-containing alcohol dehydrogenase [Clostridia bacterium]
MKIYEYPPEKLVGKRFECSCGYTHYSTVKGISVCDGAINELPETVKAIGTDTVFIVADENTFAAAGNTAVTLLEKAGIKCKVCLIKADNGFDRPEPTEKALGNIVMSYDASCGAVIGVGGGVVNDLCKLLSNTARIPYIYVPTCASMDGYTSDSASVIYNGVKTSVKCKCPDYLICDTDIISKAPKKLLLAGIGDMCAKTVSICEWRISNLITGEHYCDDVAEIMRRCFKAATDNAETAIGGDKNAVKEIVYGLITVGMAMTYAKSSRPASGVEHYYSHLWDMRCLEENRQCELHGIQVGVGTCLTLKKYEKLKKTTPDKEKALLSINSFDKQAWERGVRKYFGSSAESIIALEDKEGKYDKQKCASRLDIIVDKWDEILKIIEQELIPYGKLEALFKKIGHPTTPGEIGESDESAAKAFLHTSDIRDKYILSRLLYDTGETEPGDQ